MADPSIVLQDGVSYGPSMSRRTRTPIEFQEGSPDSLNGKFNPGNPLQNIVSLLPMLQKLKPKGNITIFPKSPENLLHDGVGETIRHEDIHALISQLQTDPTADAALPAGSYNNLAPYIKNRAGNPVNEIPAYASEKGVYPEDQRQAFIQQMVAKIAESNPKSAQIYQSLTQGGK